MKIPLHLKADDYSPRACEKRLALWMAMTRANPIGFRTQSRKKGRPLNSMHLRLNTLKAIARYGT